MQILRLVDRDGKDGGKALRGTCSSCRNAIDSKCWSVARGDLRGALHHGGGSGRSGSGRGHHPRPSATPLPPPPAAAVARLGRVELRFDRLCQNSVAELSDEDCLDFVSAVQRLRLGSIPAAAAAAATSSNPSRTLALYFGNFCITASMVGILKTLWPPGSLGYYTML